jgi:hypothetical protein
MDEAEYMWLFKLDMVDPSDEWPGLILLKEGPTERLIENAFAQNDTLVYTYWENDENFAVLDDISGKSLDCTPSRVYKLAASLPLTRHGKENNRPQIGNYRGLLRTSTGS